MEFKHIFNHFPPTSPMRSIIKIDSEESAMIAKKNGNLRHGSLKTVLLSNPKTDVAWSSSDFNRFSTLRKIKRLDSLNISLARYQNMTDKNFVWVLKMLSSVQSVSDIDLNLSGCKQISDDGLRILSRKLAKFRNLKGVKISFTG